MNQQGTSEIGEQSGSEAMTRDWEESEWFHEWLTRHEEDAAMKEED